VSTLISRVVPNAASASVIRNGISASCPRRTRGRGPRVVAPVWPKNASMMSVKVKAWPNPAPGPAPPPVASGSPPRS
jgi:hypothetical protein